MKEFILQTAMSAESNLTVEQVCVNFTVALILGMVIYISYKFSHSGAIYSARFNVSLLMLTMVTTLIMNVIGNNIALSLGMVGALSIVRFRTAVKDPRDTAYIFWCIAVGISCGVSYYVMAAIGTGMIFLMMLIMGAVKSNDRYLLIINSDTDASTRIEETVLVQYEGKALLRVKSQRRESTEYIYEMSERIIARAKKKHADLSDALMRIEGVEDVKLVCQNEEMSR